VRSASTTREDGRELALQSCDTSASALATSRALLVTRAASARPGRDGDAFWRGPPVLGAPTRRRDEPVDEVLVAAGDRLRNDAIAVTDCGPSGRARRAPPSGHRERRLHERERAARGARARGHERAHEIADPARDVAVAPRVSEAHDYYEASN